MIEIISALVGFSAPFIPEVLKYYNKKQDNEHELAMMDLQMKKGAQDHLYKMEEINTQGEISEAIELHKPQSSFGVQLLDAAKGQGLSGWALYPAFYLFCLLDFLAGMVRPGITYAAFGFYVAVKWAELAIAKTASSGLSVALLQVWGAEDRGIVILVLSYWFGNRSAKAAFGGSAMNAAKGQ
jgi:hypothetical protein